MLNLLIVVGLFIWLIVAAMLATMMGAIFAPDKNKITVRSILSVLLLKLHMEKLLDGYYKTLGLGFSTLE